MKTEPQLRTAHHLMDHLSTTIGSADLDIYLEIVRDYLEMKVWIARNKSFPIKVLRRLADKPEPAACLAVETQNRIGDQRARA